MYIYKITNKINNKIYVGQTHHPIEKRLNGHFRHARSLKKKNNYIHNAINKYGEENFVIELLDTAETKEEMDAKEIFWIKELNSTNKEIGYNLMYGGGNGLQSESTKKKIGETTKEKWEDEEMAKKMLEGLRKGTKSFSDKCKKERLLFVCPVCKKEKLLPRHIYNEKKFCSLKCAGMSSGMIGLSKANEANAIKEKNKKEKIKKMCEEWIFDNVDIVKNCPYNKISTELYGLCEYIGVKDIRTIEKAILGVYGKKKLLDYFKRLINENVC